MCALGNRRHLLLIGPSSPEEEAKVVKRLDEKMSALDREFITQHRSLTKSLFEDARLEVTQFQKTNTEQRAGAIGAMTGIQSVLV